MDSSCKSVIWQYFDITENNKAKCKTCAMELSRTGGSSTTTLKRHLQARHTGTYKDFKDKEAEIDKEKVEKSKSVNKPKADQQQTLDHVFVKPVCTLCPIVPTYILT